MPINLNLLRSFALVAEHRSFRRAAEALGRTQTAVSLQVQTLEEQVGARLFHRTTRRVDLTAEGEVLFAVARRALAEVEVGLAHLREAVDLVRGHVTLACIPTYAANRLPRVVAEFQRAFPGIGLRIVECPAPALFESVARKEVDLGVASEPEHPTDFHFTPLLRDRAYALLPRQAALKPGETIELAQLQAWPLLSLTRATSFRRSVEAAVGAKGLSIGATHEVTQVSTLIAMVEAGLGAALLPELSVPEQTSCQVRRVIKPAIQRKIGLVTARERSLSPAAAQLARVIEATHKAPSA